VGADEGFDLGVAPRRRRRLQLARAVAGEGGLLEDVAHRLEAAHEPVDVVALGKEIRVDARRAADRHSPA
jgi:hypothetical protein